MEFLYSYTWIFLIFCLIYIFIRVSVLFLFFDNLIKVHRGKDIIHIASDVFCNAVMSNSLNHLNDTNQILFSQDLMRVSLYFIFNKFYLTKLHLKKNITKLLVNEKCFNWNFKKNVAFHIFLFVNWDILFLNIN